MNFSIRHGGFESFLPVALCGVRDRKAMIIVLILGNLEWNHTYIEESASEDLKC